MSIGLRVHMNCMMISMPLGSLDPDFDIVRSGESNGKEASDRFFLGRIA